LSLVDATRRDLVAAIALGPLVACLLRAKAWASPLDARARRWILRIGEIGHAAQSGTLTPREWQDAMQEAYAVFTPEEFVRPCLRGELAMRTVTPTCLGG
jgi:hypothetical protein